MANKSSNFFSRTVDGFTEQATTFASGVKEETDHFIDNVTGEKILKSSATGKTIIEIRADLVKNPVAGTLNSTIVDPVAASFDPLYNATARSESFTLDNPDKDGKKVAPTEISGIEKPWSLFNQWSLMNYAGSPIGSFSNSDYNRPMNTGTDNSPKRNPTATYLVENTKDYPAYRYSFSDFALATHYGKISNNYLVTLRRFPTPVEDNIINPSYMGPNGVINTAAPDLARAVTWMSDTLDNKLEDILKFDVSTVWEEIKSSVQEMQSSGGAGGKLGGAIGGSGLMSAIYGSANGMDAAATNAAKTGFDATKGTYPNHIFGPINVIDKVMIRQKGLDFNQGFDLNFHYNIRQLKGVSPKVAFLDLLSNLLVLTYNNGNFWGGSVRYAGGSRAFNKPLGDQSKLKSGDFAGFLSGMMGDALSGIGKIGSDIKANGFLGSKLGNNLVGGKLMEMFGTPQGAEAINAFLTGDATGQYHVTIGNPLNPIATIGNLYCEKADFKYGGELSFEGFPTELTCTISLKPARPRDKSDIEKMFNGGKQRMYLTPEDGIDTNNNQNMSAYGNKDMPASKSDIYKRMTNG
tara:strand:+ start:843 stop:2576 length:1734 start_codon:yes stop_codon:yes gene_type:complete